MPIRKELVEGALNYDSGQARVELGLDPLRPTLLVTGGSQGARSINEAVIAALPDLNNAGIQVLHIVGEKAGLDELNTPGYRGLHTATAWMRQLRPATWRSRGRGLRP